MQVTVTLINILCIQAFFCLRQNYGCIRPSYFDPGRGLNNNVWSALDGRPKIFVVILRTFYSFLFEIRFLIEVKFYRWTDQDFGPLFTCTAKVASVPYLLHGQERENLNPPLRYKIPQIKSYLIASLVYFEQCIEMQVTVTLKNIIWIPAFFCLQQNYGCYISSYFVLAKGLNINVRSAPDVRPKISVLPPGTFFLFLF